MRKYSYSRSNRISDQLHKDISEILQLKVRDPRVKWVTIIEVEVNKDNSVATIYWTLLDEAHRLDATKALQSAASFIRAEVAVGFQTYTIPQLKFVYDESQVRGSKMLNLLNQVKQDFLPDETDD